MHDRRAAGTPDRLLVEMTDLARVEEQHDRPGEIAHGRLAVHDFQLRSRRVKPPESNPRIMPTPAPGWRKSVGNAAVKPTTPTDTVEQPLSMRRGDRRRSRGPVGCRVRSPGTKSVA